MEASLASLIEECKSFEDMEVAVFEFMSRLCRDLLRKALETLDLRLSQGRGAGLRLVGKRERTITTRFGDVTFERRLYQEKETGAYHFLLDEATGLPKREGLSSSVIKLALLLAVQMPFRRAVAILRAVLPQAISVTALQKRVWRFGERVEQAEAEKQEATFGDGEVPEMGKERISRLFVEGDGVLVALQRENRRRGEVKVGIGYAGWKRVSQDRYELKGKIAHAGVEEPAVFWERYWLEAAKRYDLSHLKDVVLNGDGANWVREGAMGIPGAIQLDRFHLLRALKQTFCEEGEWASTIYQEATRGNWEGVEILMDSFLSKEDLAPERRQAVEAIHRYLMNNKEGLCDWRLRVEHQPEDRGLGAMEGNVDKLIAVRTKRRGMSWRLKGLHCMAKLLQCFHGGEIELYAYPRRHSHTQLRQQREPRSRDRITQTSRAFGVQLPALAGPHANRPWVRLLRALSNPYPA